MSPSLNVPKSLLASSTTKAILIAPLSIIFNASFIVIFSKQLTLSFS